jgi:hypothetical protein
MDPDNCETLTTGIEPFNKPRRVRTSPLPKDQLPDPQLFQLSLVGEAFSEIASRSICDGLFSHAFPVAPACTRPIVGPPTGVEARRPPGPRRHPRLPAPLQKPQCARVLGTPALPRRSPTACPTRNSRSFFFPHFCADTIEFLPKTAIVGKSLVDIQPYSIDYKAVRSPEKNLDQSGE